MILLAVTITSFVLPGKSTKDITGVVDNTGIWSDWIF